MPVAPAILCAAIGLGLFLIGFYQRRKLRASLSWPQVMGTVTRNTLEKYETHDDDGYSLRYSPRVEYQYVAGGVSHTSTRLALSQTSYADPKKAQAELDRFPPGAQVAVYFDPRKPSYSVLIRQARGSGFLLWAGLIMLVVVLAALVKG